MQDCASNQARNDIRDLQSSPAFLIPCPWPANGSMTCKLPKGAVTYAECALVPRNEVDDVEACSVESRAPILAQVEFSGPQEQISGRGQYSVDIEHKVPDRLFAHLLQCTSAPAAVLALIFHMIAFRAHPDIVDQKKPKGWFSLKASPKIQVHPP